MQPLIASSSSAFVASLGVRLPVFSAGMAFVAGPPLAAAVSEAGGMGFLGAGLAPPAAVTGLIEATRSLTSRPFGIDFVTPFVTPEHLEACLQARPRVVVFFWAPPPASWVRQLQARGIGVWMQVGTPAEALEARDLGIDALIVQGAEAGGHNRASAGLISLLPAVVDAVAPLPVVAAGGIADGRGLAAALTLGASAVWCGTRFLASNEAHAHAEYKQRVVEAAVDDTVRNTHFDAEWPGQPMRVLRNREVRAWEAGLGAAADGADSGAPVGTTVLGGQEVPVPPRSVLLPTPETRGDFERMGLTMGESAGLIRSIEPAAVIVRRMVSDAEALLGRRLAHDGPPAPAPGAHRAPAACA